METQNSKQQVRVDAEERSHRNEAGPLGKYLVHINPDEGPGSPRSLVSVGRRLGPPLSWSEKTRAAAERNYLIRVPHLRQARSSGRRPSTAVASTGTTADGPPASRGVAAWPAVAGTTRDSPVPWARLAS